MYLCVHVLMCAVVCVSVCPRAGIVQVYEECRDEEATEYGRNSHSVLPGHECSTVTEVVDLAPILMDPPFPVFKYLAQNYRLTGAPPALMCQHNAMVRRGRVLGPLMLRVVLWGFVGAFILLHKGLCDAFFCLVCRWRKQRAVPSCATCGWSWR